MLTFVAGPPRSGTTLLQTVLCRSFGSAVLGECAAVAEVIHHRLTYLKIGGECMPEYLGCGDEDLDRATKAFLNQLLGNISTRTPQVLKSPNLTHLIPHLHRFFDRPIRTVCIVRDPRDAIASLLRVQLRQGRARDLVEAANFMGGFYEDIATSVGTQQSSNPVHLIRYEDLVAIDRGTLRSLSAFIGSAIRFGRGLNERWLAPDNPWYSTLYAKPITAARIGSYRDHLTPDEIGAIDESYARFYERFGYARHEDAPGVKEAA